MLQYERRTKGLKSVKHKFPRNLNLLLAAALLVTILGVSVSVGAQQSADSALTARAAARQAAFKAQVDAVPKQRILSNCKAVQEQLVNLRAKKAAAASKRLEVYTKLSTRLDSITAKLRAQGIGSDGLEKSQEQFTEFYSRFKTDSQAYKEALNDTIKIDCTADPSGFQASLLETRQLHAKLAKDASDLKATVPLLAEGLTAAKQALLDKENQ